MTGNERLLKTNDGTSPKELTQLLKRLSRHITGIKNSANLIGRNNDTVQFRHKLTSSVASGSQMVMQLKKGLSRGQLDCSSSVTRDELEKIEAQFLEQYQRFRGITSQIQETLHQYPTPAALAKKAQHEKNALLPNTNNDGNNSSANTNSNRNTGGGGGGGGQRQQQQQIYQEREEQQMFQEIDYDTTEMENFEEQIHAIVEELEHLYEAHRDLNELIDEGNSMIERLEENVTSAHDNVEVGTAHLTQAATHQRAYRGKLCCFLAIVVTLAAVITIIVLATNN